MSVNRKNKLCIDVEWKAHLFMASNVYPAFNDVSGNIARRFASYQFKKPITKTDPDMFSKLKAERPLILLKMCLAYSEAVRQFGSKGLWEKHEGVPILPKMCHDAKRDFLCECDPLAGYLSSNLVVFNSMYITEATRFTRSFDIWSKENFVKRKMYKMTPMNSVYTLSCFNCKWNMSEGVSEIVGVRVLEFADEDADYGDIN